MTSQVTITLTEPLAEAARAQGLLQPPALEQLLKRELARKTFERMAGLRNLPGVAPSADEVQEEISASRRQQQK